MSKDYLEKTASQLDFLHPSKTKHLFHIPENKTYLCGNSLGLQPISTQKLVSQELAVWANQGVTGHFDHPHSRPWVTIDDTVVDQASEIVGAKQTEVAIANTLTVNLHLLMVSFYQPTATRYKILMEAKSFPSDYFAIESQVKFHGFDPNDAIIQLKPANGDIFSTQEITEYIKQNGNEIALVLFSGVQYYTGQAFEILDITSTAREAGCVVGWDLAHAVGNVELKLHDWGVDFAAWCSYKYLNSGPGWFLIISGWWGSKPETKFEMDLKFDPIIGANSYRLSNPCVLSIMTLYASMQVFATTSMKELRERSVLLTGYLEHLLSKNPKKYRIITPADPKQRGCQLSIQFESEANMMAVFRGLSEQGIVVDERKPDVIRVSPAPLYNTFEDVATFFASFEKLLA